MKAFMVQCSFWSKKYSIVSSILGTFQFLLLLDFWPIWNGKMLKVFKRRTMCGIINEGFCIVYCMMYYVKFMDTFIWFFWGHAQRKKLKNVVPLILLCYFHLYFPCRNALYVNCLFLYGRIYDVFYAIKLISLGQQKNKTPTVGNPNPFFEAFHRKWVCTHNFYFKLHVI